MNLDQYMAVQRGAEIPTPVTVKVDGKVELQSLNHILYGARAKEPVTKLRRRMADVITRCTTASGATTRKDLLANFTEAEIEAHAEAAWQLAGLHRLGETL